MLKELWASGEKRAQTALSITVSYECQIRLKMSSCTPQPFKSEMYRKIKERDSLYEKIIWDFYFSFFWLTLHTF